MKKSRPVTYADYLAKLAAAIGRARVEKYEHVVKAKDFFDSGVPWQSVQCSIRYLEKVDAFHAANEGVTLKVGDRVIDIWGNFGIVRKIERGTSIEEHGFIDVFLENKILPPENYIDNCESYSEINWRDFMRLKEKP